MAQSSQNQRQRDPRLDLLKWLALFFMVIDHLRYVSPIFSWCYILGRLAFPFFSLVIAAHIQNILGSATPQKSVIKYLLWMIAFAVISEWPFELFTPKARSLNVFVTLFLSILFMAGFIKDKFTGILLGFAVIGFSFWLQTKLMYGIAGILLPYAFLLALRNGSLSWCFPTILCFMANYRYVSVDTLLQLKLYPIAALLFSLLAVFIGKQILTMTLPLKIWPVKKWAYVFYPIHLLALYAIRMIV